MQIQQIDQMKRKSVNEFILKRWYSMVMVVHGESISLENADGWFASEDEIIIGLITYRIVNSEMEILSLDSLREKNGIGTALINKVIEVAKNKDCTRIKLITTNDNLSALRFYQKRGFEMARLYRNAVEESRIVKPQIPITGEDGIPIRHEIELEMYLGEPVLKCKIASLYICVNDMERAIHFYEDFFDMPVTEYDETYSVFDIAGFRFGLFAYQNMKEDHPFGSNCLPSIGVESVDILKDKLDGKEICFPLTRIKDNWVAEFVDSEGNHIEITAPAYKTN